MLQNISWLQYFTILLVATILYYFFLWLIVFKGKLNFLPALTNRMSAIQGEDTPDEMLTSAQFIMDELRPLFPNRSNKNELILALHLELKRYAGWDDPSFRDTINRFIIDESQSKCSIRLGEDDLRALWE
jgi:hypothetical protein